MNVLNARQVGLIGKWSVYTLLFFVVWTLVVNAVSWAADCLPRCGMSDEWEILIQNGYGAIEFDHNDCFGPAWATQCFSSFCSSPTSACQNLTLAHPYANCESGIPDCVPLGAYYIATGDAIDCDDAVQETNMHQCKETGA
jgi:hypothetical protein